MDLTSWIDDAGAAGSSHESSPGKSGASSDISGPAYAGPRTRQRVHKTPPALAVPDINEDAAERKRVLNVLAQRRYSKPASQLTPSGNEEEGVADAKRAKLHRRA